MTKVPTPSLPPASGPEPPLQAQVETALHPQQLGNGVVKYYRAFARAEEAYRITNDSIHLKREMPILYAYTGGESNEMESNKVVFDVAVLTKSIVLADADQQDAARKKLLQQVLGPWNNYFVAEYTKQLRELALFSRNAWCAFSGSEWVPGESPLGFDEIIGIIHIEYENFIKHWELFDASLKGKTVNDPLLQVVGAEGQLSLSAILQLAGVTDRAKVAKVGSHLISNQTAELQQRMLPCLKIIAVNANLAIQMLDREIAEI